MKINVPIVDVEDVDFVAGLGVHEIYCGVVDGDNQRRIDGGFLNRRPNEAANVASWQGFGDIVGRAHAHGITVNLVLNEPFYREDEYPQVLDSARQAAELGADAFIVADPLAVKLLAARGLRVHVSCVGSCFNSHSIDFFHRLGVKRVILPRHLSLADVAAIRDSSPGIELEVIVIGDPCQWDDGLCSCEHCLQFVAEDAPPPFGGGLCAKAPEWLTVSVHGHDAHEALPWHEILDDFYGLDGCGLCYVWALERMGIDVAKSAGRDRTYVRRAHAQHLATAVSLLDDRALTDSEYRDFARDIRSRMFKDFVVERVLAAAASGLEPSALGNHVQQILGEAQFLACREPTSCYFVPERDDLPVGRVGTGAASRRPRAPETTTSPSG